MTLLTEDHVNDQPTSMSPHESMHPSGQVDTDVEKLPPARLMITKMVRLYLNTVILLLDVVPYSF
jgi:hypothetical protein